MDTRRECRNSVLFPGPKLMVSQISELRAKLEESETALAEAKATIGDVKGLRTESRVRVRVESRVESSPSRVRVESEFRGSDVPCVQQDVF